MKILLDVLCDVWHDCIQLREHDVSGVARLRKQDCDLRNGPAVIAYARDNGTVLVAKDNRCGRECETAAFRAYCCMMRRHSGRFWQS